MRYHLETIPVWDAWKEGGECPLCDMEQAAEESYLENFLGASVMEPSMREEVNRKGFCARHFARMLPMKNRLGLALMTHTILKEAMRETPAPAAPRRGLLARHKAPGAERQETCILCERLRGAMDRYCYTAVRLFETDAEFKAVFLASKGVCIPHAQALAAMAAQTLPQARAQAFAQALCALQKENLARVEEELDWFTRKFDYRNAEKPWGNAKDAPERAIRKLRGRY